MREMGLAWPVARSTPITQRFGANPGVYARFGLAGHNGLDFGIPVGTAVLAAAHGVVDRVVHQADDGYGRHVRLRHAGGALTIYAHLDSAAVETGQEMSAGAVLGHRATAVFPPVRTCILNCACPEKCITVSAGQWTRCPCWMRPRAGWWKRICLEGSENGG